MSTQPPRREEAPPPTLCLVDPSSAGQEQEQTLVHANPPSGDPTQVSSDKTLTEGPSIVPPGYEVLAELGRGGMGVVYRARQILADRPVALKMILAGGHASAQELARFHTEAEAIARLQHPNIVQVFDVGEHQGLPFFSLELCSGGSLEERLEEKPLKVKEATLLVEKLARAMQLAHEKGIIHRDLKPANVLFTEDGTPRITDFGLAKKLDVQEGHTQTGSIMGTPSYMAPEQAQGKSHELGPACDIYALGAILYDCLTGRPPFKAATALETILQVSRGDPVPPSQLILGLPRDIETITLKCLEKDPHRRYATAGELADDLRHYLNDEPIQARAVSKPELLWRWGKRNPARAALLGVSLLALLVLLGAGAWFNRRLAAELEQTEKARAAATEAEQTLQTSLTREVAEELDSDLRQLAAIPQTLAGVLAQRTDWTEENLADCLRQLLAQEPRLFGCCIAFEPHAFSPTREDFALYAYRDRKGLTTKQLLPPDYTPLYREWAWYRLPREQRRALWSEPYIDEGGGDIPMITYSVPLIRNGNLAGVITADLSIDYFDDLHGSLKKLGLAPEDYGFVVSKSGTFLSHPDPKYRMPHTLQEVLATRNDPGLATLIEQIKHKDSGSVQATDFASGKPAQMLFARVATSGWTFVAVFPEGEHVRD